MFGQLLPDGPDYKNPGVIRANNAFPSAGGYSPFRGGGTTGGGTSGVCRGAKFLARSTKDAITVGGGPTKLWVDVSGTVTVTSGYTDIGQDSYWRFQQFGQYVFATAPNNNLQYLTNIDSDVTWGAHPDAPSQAQIIGRVGDHLMVGNIAGNPYAFEWSGLNDPLAFTATAINLAGSAELDSRYGQITGIVGDRYPLIFQEYGVSRITPVGPPSVFRADTMEEARGAIAPGAIVTVGFVTYFLAHDGFWATDGASVQPIGTSRVNQFFKTTASDEDLFRTHGTVDWENQSVVWTFYPLGGTSFANQIIYSWAERRWSTAEVPVHWLVEGTVDATSLEDLDAIYTSLEDVPVSLDSAIFHARGRRLSAYIPSGSNTVLTALDGDTLKTEFETGEWQVMTGQRVFLDRIYPLVENPSQNTTAVAITRAQKGAPEVYSAPGALNVAGFCPVRADGRFARVKITIPAGAGWDKAQGVQVRARASGER